MQDSVGQKTWVSPITAVSFVAVAVTGVLMLFELRLPGLKGIHEWMGLVLALAGLLHLILNWRTLVCYFRRRSALVALAVGLALLLGTLFIPSGGEHGRHGPGGPRERPSDVDAD